jgi:hypothetical protein
LNHRHTFSLAMFQIMPGSSSIHPDHTLTALDCSDVIY